VQRKLGLHTSCAALRAHVNTQRFSRRGVPRARRHSALFRSGFNRQPWVGGPLTTASRSRTTWPRALAMSAAIRQHEAPSLQRRGDGRRLHLPSGQHRPRPRGYRHAQASFADLQRLTRRKFVCVATKRGVTHDAVHLSNRIQFDPVSLHWAGLRVETRSEQNVWFARRCFDGVCATTRWGLRDGVLTQWGLRDDATGRRARRNPLREQYVDVTFTRLSARLRTPARPEQNRVSTH
jgi:hypothetical protein